MYKYVSYRVLPLEAELLLRLLVIRQVGVALIG